MGNLLVGGSSPPCCPNFNIMVRKSYVDYWLSKGEYGRIRVARFLKRKEAKKLKKMCKCGNNHKAALHSCPFAEDMHGDYTLTCNCCGDCSHQCAMDI